jgi:hypothetical protein
MVRRSINLLAHGHVVDVCHLRHAHHGWKIAAQAVGATASQGFLTTLATFMNDLVAKFDGFPSFRVGWLLDASKAGLLDALKSKDAVMPLLEPLVEMPEEAVANTHMIFGGINPFNVKVLVETVLKTTDQPALVHSVILGLTDLALNTNQIFKPCVELYAAANNKDGYL